MPNSVKVVKEGKGRRLFLNDVEIKDVLSYKINVESGKIPSIDITIVLDELSQDTNIGKINWTTERR